MTSIVLTGVGGQDLQLACDVLGRTAVGAGAMLKICEDRGPVQCGSSLICHVRFSKNSEVFSPTVARGEADVLIAMEIREALRCAAYLEAGGGCAYVNRLLLGPGQPAAVERKLRERLPRCLLLDAEPLAAQADVPRASCAVLLGAAAASLDLPKELWLEAVRESIRPQYVPGSLQAFEMGYAASTSWEAAS